MRLLFSGPETPNFVAEEAQDLSVPAPSVASPCDDDGAARVAHASGLPPDMSVIGRTDCIDQLELER